MSFFLIVEEPEEVETGAWAITGGMVQWESDQALKVIHTHTHGGAVGCKCYE